MRVHVGVYGRTIAKAREDKGRQTDGLPRIACKLCMKNLRSLMPSQVRRERAQTVTSAIVLAAGWSMASRPILSLKPR